MADPVETQTPARYAPPALDPPRVRLMGIPKGYPGTRRTADEMGRLIREGAKDFYVRQKAIDILLERGIRPKDYLGEIRALFEWVQGNVRYTKDPFHVELLHSPRRMLELRAGDCDDMSILLGAMLEAIGHPVRLVLVGPDPTRPRLFSHVYLEARHQGRWISLDPTMPHPMGWAPRAWNRQVITVRRGPDAAKENGGPRAMSNGYMGLAQDELVQALGPGTVGEVRQGPDGQPLPVGDRSRRARQPGRPLEPAANGGQRGSAATAEPVPALRACPAPTAASSRRDGPGTMVVPDGHAGLAGLHRAGHTRHPARSPRAGTPGPGPSGASPLAGTQASRAADAEPVASRGPAADLAGWAGGATAAKDDASDGADLAPRRVAPGGRSGPGRGSGVDSRPKGVLAFSAAEAATVASAVAGTDDHRGRSVAMSSSRRPPPPAPARLVPLGDLVGLIYRSDRYDQGRPRTYIHFMRYPPRLVSDATGRQLYIVGGRYRVTRDGIEDGPAPRPAVRREV